MGFIEEAASLPALRVALDVLVQNRGGAGPDGVTAAAFAMSAAHELTQLQDELLSGRYRPRPARRVKIPKGGGGYRNLAVGCVRDRVVQHALAATLTAHLDGALHRFAWAWRKGRSTYDALRAVDEALAAGRQWVLRGDIEEFFDRIPGPDLLAAVEEHTHDAELVALLERLLAAGVLAGGEIVDPSQGTSQGSPLSPFLANLYLTPFDRAVEAAGFEMVRYGDDLCVPALMRDDARRAKDVVTAGLERLRLQLNPQKVSVRHLGEGFTFLGFAFHTGGRRPGTKAARNLAEGLEEILAKRPNDSAEEVDKALRGWLSYYGSLSGVALPDAVRARAEALESSRAEAQQFGALPVRGATVTIERTPEVIARALRAQAVGTSPPSRWLSAALSLHGAGAEDRARMVESLGAEFALDRATAAALVEAIGRFEGSRVAEILAWNARYEEAEEALALTPPSDLTAPPAQTRGLPVEPVEQTEAPRFEPKPADAERMLALFGGAEHVFQRDVRVGDRVERQRVTMAPTVEHVRAHFDGSFWMAVYPHRANHSVRWAAFRIVQAGRDRHGARGAVTLTEAVREDARRVRAALRELGLTPTISVEPDRAVVLWLLFTDPIPAARARALTALVSHRAGAVPAAVTRELFPLQDVVRPDKPGSAMLLPLGLDPRSNARAWLLDDDFTPVADPCATLCEAIQTPVADVNRALGVKVLGFAQKPSAASPLASTLASPAAPAAAEKAVVKLPVVADVVALETSPFHELPRAQDVYRGCAVFRHTVDQCLAGAGLVTSDRMFVADVLARLGSEAGPAAEAVFRHLDDYKPGMGARALQRIYPHPTSCGRIRQKLPELTAKVGCDCHFRVPPGAYPTPVLHAMGAAEVPGMSDRVKEAASRGGVARAAMAAMNEGRKELGVKGAALCARLADLRRQARVLDKTITGVEDELGALVDEAGDTPIETPSGTLRRVMEGGRRRFVLEV